MWDSLLWIYILNATLLINHEIDSSYWKEWNLISLLSGRSSNVNNDQNNDAELMLYDDLMKEYGEKFKIDAFVSGKMLDDMGNGFKTYEKNDFNIPIFYPLIALSNEELAQLEQKVF